MIDMDYNTLKQALKKLVIEECDKDIEVSDITDDELLFGGPLDLDSLDALQICMAVKSHYGVRIEGGPKARASLQSINCLAETIIAESPLSGGAVTEASVEAAPGSKVPTARLG